MYTVYILYVEEEYFTNVFVKNKPTSIPNHKRPSQTHSFSSSMNSLCIPSVPTLPYLRISMSIIRNNPIIAQIIKSRTMFTSLNTYVLLL